MKNNYFDVETMSFAFDYTAIENPTCSPCGRFSVDPRGYDFYVEHTGGGCTAWVKKLENGFLVMTNEASHELGLIGESFTMCFYDGDQEEDAWGNRVACADLQVGEVPQPITSNDGSVVDHSTLCKIINKVYDECDIFIDKDQALAMVDVFKKIDLANT